ncbi:hypothetical protein ACEWPN_20930 [Yoonia sp. R2-816]
MLNSAPATNTQPQLQSNDYHQLPVTEKQLSFARSIAQRSGIVLPWDVQQDRHRLSRWIDRNQGKKRETSPFDDYPSSKQVAFAERIARYKRSEVPHECFKDKSLMSRWIDSNK